MAERKSDIVVQVVTRDDVVELVRLRRMMFEWMGIDESTQLAAADDAALTYFHEAVSTGRFHGWLARNAMGVAVGSGGVVIDQHPPTPNNLSGKIGYLINVVTIPDYRHHGVASLLIAAILRWLTVQGIHVVSLHTTDMARPLYEKLGFKDTHEMRLIIQSNSCPH